MEGRRFQRLGAVLALLVVAVVFGIVGTAGAATYNSTCTNCHSSAGQWDAGTVDRATACQKCHTPGLLGSHPYHNPGSNCGAVCHPGWGSSAQYATPAWGGVAGSFASSSSVNVSPAVLHVIHSNPKWMSGLSTADSECASCHSVAACSACHEDAPTPFHEAHASANGTPDWTGVVGSGIVGEDQTVRSAVYTSNRCSTPECHNLTGSQSRTPVSVEDNGVGVSKNPVLNWSTRYAGNYTAGRVAWSNKAATTMTFTFTGQQVEIVSDRDPYRGYMGVSVDGGPETVIDCYSSTSQFQQIVFRSPVVTQGTHTVTVRVLGTKNAAARANYVFVDAFRYYSTMAESIAPACISCHSATCSGIGGGFTHEATATAGTYEGLACTQCHTKLLKTEHLRTSSNTASKSCSACHTVYADYQFDSYDYTCGSTGDAGRPGCHQAAQAPHLGRETSHTVTPTAQTADCIGCHSGNLGVIHNDSNPTRPQHASLTGGGSNGDAYSTSCMTCHNASSVPTNKDCTSAACHVASGVVSMATHPAPEHDASPALGEASRTAGKACSTCHAINAVSGKIDAIGDHGKATAKTAGGAPVGCMSCHGAPYYPTDWLGQNNTCVACHPADGTKAGAPHEAAEYSAKHNFSADAGNSTSCGSGAGLFCHNTDAADVIHDASNPGTSDCESCHTAAVRQSGVPTVRACSGCHATNHNLSKHAVSASAECVACHGSNDVRTLHANCQTCHANPAFPGLTGSVATADCVNCHKSGSVGNKTYSPADGNHATGSESTHTATPFTAVYQGAGSDGTVAAEGKECSVCHSSTLKTAHASTSTNGGSVTCVECHTDTTLGGRATALADWPGKKCTTCHDTGAARTHADYGTAHVVPAGTCAGTGSSCHDFTDLAKLHDKNQIGGVAKYSSCSNRDAGDPSACHYVKDGRPVRWADPAASCGQGTSGCHTEKTAANHGKKHNLTIASSTYSDGTGEGVAAGCLSAGGGGCHDSLGSGNTSVDIAAYHQTTQCADSVCHTSVDKPTTHQPFACADCHDGTFAGGSDTVALADASPSGHYGAALHTATGGLGNVKLTGGATQEPCTTCHDLSLKDAHTGIATQTKGTNVTCAECHSYSLSVTTEVKVANWTTNACSDCHNASVVSLSVQHPTTVTASVVATGSVGCGSSGRNCHNSADLHTLHKDAPAGCDLAGCHDASNKNRRPSKKSCGSTGTCHTTGYNTGTTFPTHTPSEEASHAPTAATQESAAWSVSGQSVACGACHLVSSTDGGLRAEHIKTTSAKSLSATNVCLNCHNNAAADSAIVGGAWAANRNTTSACLTCHTAANGIGIHADANSTAHADVASTSCGNTGAGCHPTADLSSVGTPSTTANIHTTCLRCHDHAGSATVPAPGGGNMAWNPALDTCGTGRECHNIGTQYPTTGDPIHRNTLADAANGDDTVHHTGVAATKVNYPESGTGVYSNNVACGTCHANTLKAAHAVTSTNAGSVTCLECHNGSGAITSAVAAGQVKANWAADKCTDCHASASTHATFKSGTGYSANHVSTMNAGCAGSGAGCHGTAPDSLTAVAPAGEMSQLHATPGCSSSSGTAGTSCHALNKPMSATAKTCGSGSNCHNTYTTTAGHAANTVTGNDATHTVTAASMSGSADAAFTYGTACSTCHSAGLRSAHSTVTVTMESGATWAAGAAPFCTNCHNTTTPVNAASTIKTSAWNKTCDACHVTNGNGKHGRYTTATHTSTTAGCTLSSGCHGFSGTQTVDVRALHDRSGVGCSASGSDSKGWAGGCHSLDKSMAGQAMTCGDTGACHNGHTASNHLPDHDANKALGTQVGTLVGQTYGYGTNVGCFKAGGLQGCHFADLRLEHGTTSYITSQVTTTTPAPVQRTMEGARGGSTDGCTVCHASGQGTAGAYASRSAIVSAMNNGDYRCVSCHFETSDAAGTTGVQRPHASTQVVTPASQGTTYEFTDPAAGGNTITGSGHNSFGVKYPRTTGFGTVNTVNVTGSWAFGGTLKAGWTASSVVRCVDCHEKTTTTPNGPQGAAVPYYISSGGTAGAGQATVSNWAHTPLTSSTSIPPLCAKCHASLSAALHGRSAHNTGMQCRNCHIEIPHAWRRPRLLRRTVGDNGLATGTSGGVAVDAAPYVDTAADGAPGYIKGIIVTANPTPVQGNCVVGGCNAHNASFSNGKLWP